MVNEGSGLELWVSVFRMKWGAMEPLRIFQPLVLDVFGFILNYSHLLRFIALLYGHSRQQPPLERKYIVHRLWDHVFFELVLFGRCIMVLLLPTQNSRPQSESKWSPLYRSVSSMGCGAGKGAGQVAPVTDGDTSPNNGSEVLERADRSRWGKLMVGFLMAKLDRLVQEALAGLKQDDCELFAHHIDKEFSDTWEQPWYLHAVVLGCYSQEMSFN